MSAGSQILLRELCGISLQALRSKAFHRTLANQYIAARPPHPSLRCVTLRSVGGSPGQTERAFHRLHNLRVQFHR